MEEHFRLRVQWLKQWSVSDEEGVEKRPVRALDPNGRGIIHEPCWYSSLLNSSSCSRAACSRGRCVHQPRGTSRQNGMRRRNSSG